MFVCLFDFKSIGVNSWYYVAFTNMLKRHKDLDYKSWCEIKYCVANYAKVDLLTLWRHDRCLWNLWITCDTLMYAYSIDFDVQIILRGFRSLLHLTQIFDNYTIMSLGLVGFYNYPFIQRFLDIDISFPAANNSFHCSSGWPWIVFLASNMVLDVSIC